MLGLGLVGVVNLDGTARVRATLGLVLGLGLELALALGLA